MIVIDASAALDLLLQTPASTRIWARLFQSGETLHAPHLIDLEIGQVLRRFALRGELSAARCEACLADWRALSVRRYGHRMLLPRVWELRETLTTYDAAYIALAETLGAVLVCSDGKLARASGHFADVEVLA